MLATGWGFSSFAGMAKVAHGGHSPLVFRLSCWVLGLIAFAQLITAGIALAVRFENAQTVKVVEKPVPKIITLNAPAAVEASPPPSSPPVVVPPPVIMEEAPLPSPRPLLAPPIADPVVERLVNEARKARVAQDMITAIVKLDEAREKAAKDPSVLYEMALVYENMAVDDPRLADQAADAYQAVFELGTTGAGALYELAAAKLRDGIAMPADMRGELSLGRPRIFHDDESVAGERVVVTIPVQAAPGTHIENPSRDLAVKVRFFTSSKRDGIQETGSDGATTNYEWVSGAFDFAGGEELLRVIYILPPMDSQQEHLFGNRKYYGLIAEVEYKGELIDSYPWPRHLASHSRVESRQPDMVPEFLDHDDMLLPLLPGGEDLPDMIPTDLIDLPPLPER